MATVYYLNWDQETEEHGSATELLHKITVKEVLEDDEKPGNEYSCNEFDQLYREIGEADVDDCEEAWRQWNRGSGYESREFLEHRERSMSVGDVIEIEGTYHQAQSIGWDEIAVDKNMKTGESSE